MQRVGIDATSAYLVGGMQDWISNGYKTSNVGLVSAEYLHRLLIETENPLH
jgi:hypothetical protein